MSSIYVQLSPLKLNFDLDRGVFPMVIQAVVDEGDGKSLELHRTNTNIESVKKGTFFYILSLIYATV